MLSDRDQSLRTESTQKILTFAILFRLEFFHTHPLLEDFVSLFCHIIMLGASLSHMKVWPRHCVAVKVFLIDMLQEKQNSDGTLTN